MRSVEDVGGLVESGVRGVDVGAVVRENEVDVGGTREVLDGDDSTVWLVVGADEVFEAIVGSCVVLSTTSVALAFAKLDMASLKTESALVDAADSVVDIVALC